MVSEPAPVLPPEVPELWLYSLNQITLAAFLGSPFPGLWLAARNLDALGRWGMYRRCLGWGAGLTLVNLALAFFVPAQVPGIVVSVPFIIAARLMANHWLGPDLAAHSAAGGAQGSWWMTILVGVLGLLAVLALIIVPVVVMDIVSPIRVPAT
jgi:hypothetical protein